MDSIPSAAYTLIALFAIGVPFLAVFTLVRVSSLQKTLDQIPRLIARIYSLEQQVAELQRRLTAPQTRSEPAAPTVPMATPPPAVPTDKFSPATATPLDAPPV